MRGDTGKIRALTADDHAVVREGMRRMLEQEADGQASKVEFLIDFGQGTTRVCITDHGRRAALEGCSEEPLSAEPRA
jgi:DNA-binding NarL/FixJ family response regulator